MHVLKCIVLFHHHREIRSRIGTEHARDDVHMREMERAREHISALERQTAHLAAEAETTQRKLDAATQSFEAQRSAWQQASRRQEEMIDSLAKADFGHGAERRKIEQDYDRKLSELSAELANQVQKFNAASATHESQRISLGDTIAKLQRKCEDLTRAAGQAAQYEALVIKLERDLASQREQNAVERAELAEALETVNRTLASKERDPPREIEMLKNEVNDLKMRLRESEALRAEALAVRDQVHFCTPLN